MADQVEEIKSKTDIVSLIGEYITLKKAGRNYKALCPFHSEKTPSFMVSPELQIYKCFGCQKGGDVISFLQEYEGMEFYEALKHLAERAGVKLKPLKGGEKGIRERIYEINLLASRFYSYILTRHPVGRKALNYLLKDRGLKLETINEFGLGYSPDVPLALKKFLVEKKKISLDELVLSGIVYKDEKKVVDRFRGRIIFPLFDHRGNIVGFAGRVLPGAGEDVAKYINTPETEAYHKSKVLYGLNLTKAEIKKKNYAIVVEGELDMISSWQIGVKNVVAIKGSALTQEQVKLLSRYTNRIVLALDSDAAGSEASRRGIEIAEKEGFEIKVAQIKGFKDPDEMARKAPEKYKGALRNSVGVWDFLIDLTFSKHKDKGGVFKAKVSREVIPILASIGDKIVQAHYIQVVAEKLGVSADAVREQLQSVLTPARSATPEVVLLKKDKKTRRELLEERFLSLVFAYDVKTLLKKDNKKLVKTPFCKRIVEEVVGFLKAKGEFDPSEFAAMLPPELRSGYINLVLGKIEGVDEEDLSSLVREIEVVVRELTLMDLREKMKKVAQKIAVLEESKEYEKSKKAQEYFKALSDRLSLLEEKEFKGIILDR